jgi:hypothetical protein
MIKIDFPTEQVKVWVEKAKGLPLTFAVEFLQDMNEQVVYATPYITGNLRGSWYANIDSEPNALSGPPDGGASAVARLNMVLADLELGGVYYAVNGAVYGPFVEYGTQHIAPRAFVRGTVDRAQEIADAAALRISQS